METTGRIKFPLGLLKRTLMGHDRTVNASARFYVEQKARHGIFLVSAREYVG